MNFRTIARFNDGLVALRVMKRLSQMEGVVKADASTILFPFNGKIFLSPSEYHETFNIIEVKG